MKRTENSPQMPAQLNPDFENWTAYSDIKIQSDNENQHNTIKVKAVVSTMPGLITDSNNTFISRGNVFLEVSPTTAIRNIKKGITDAMNICYEDMIFIDSSGKRMRDATCINKYLSGNQMDEPLIHIKVATENELFKTVFEMFKRLGRSEEKAWLATFTFVQVIRHNSSQAVEQILHEWQRQHAPGADISNETSALQNTVYVPTDNSIREVELAMLCVMSVYKEDHRNSQDEGDVVSDDDEANSQDQENSENDGEESSAEDEADHHDQENLNNDRDEENSINEENSDEEESVDEDEDYAEYQGYSDSDEDSDEEEHVYEKLSINIDFVETNGAA